MGRTLAVVVFLSALSYHFCSVNAFSALNPSCRAQESGCLNSGSHLFLSKNDGTSDISRVVHTQQSHWNPQVPDGGKWMRNLFTVVCGGILILQTSIPLPSSVESNAAWAAGNDMGATSVSNSKITTGGASTLQSGRTITITRGVNLDFSNFANQNLKGVAFQQSIVRDANFKNSNLVGASFFDATVDGSDFEDADLTNANFEMAQLKRANLKNAVTRDMYISGSTLFEGIKNIENTDWTDTYLRADQKKLLCAHPTAKGINPKTGVETRESLMCP